MPEMSSPPGAPPAVPGQPQQGQSPPIGSSPVTGPTQNRGYEVAAIKMAGMALKALEQVISLAGAQSELGKAALDSVKKLATYVPPGAVSPADIMNLMKSMMMKQQQAGANMQAMQAQQAAPQQAQPPAAGAAQPPPQMKAA